MSRAFARGSHTFYMKTIDLHQDIYLHMRFKDEVGQSHQTDFEMIKNSDIDLSFATAFPYPKDENWYDPITDDLITEELGMYRNFCDQNTDWMIVNDTRDLDDSRKKLLLHLEGLNVFSGSDEHWKLLNSWFELGVRSLGTHWNVNNKLGGGTLDPTAPLTELGSEVIAWAEQKGILLDFAHMSRQTFADATKIVSRPILVSHGNTDALCPDPRNYTDKQIKQIAESGGLIGVFFASTFVAGKDAISTIDHVVGHIKYIKDLVGVQHIGIGSDFGGILSHDIDDLASVDEFNNLFIKMSESGMSVSEIEDIAYNNARRMIESHLA